MEAAVAYVKELSHHLRGEEQRGRQVTREPAFRPRFEPKTSALRCYHYIVTFHGISVVVVFLCFRADKRRVETVHPCPSLIFLLRI
jgi:hypothetical protein